MHDFEENEDRTITMWYVLVIIEEHGALLDLSEFFTDYGVHQRYQINSVAAWLGY